MAGGAAASSTATADALGYLGGSILSICVLPQIWKTFRTKSAGDISLLWTILYTAGLSCTFAYLVLVGATAAWIPMIVEIAGALVIMAMKVVYDRREAGLVGDAGSQRSACSGVATPRTSLSFSSQRGGASFSAPNGGASLSYQGEGDGNMPCKITAWQQEGDMHGCIAAPDAVDLHAVPERHSQAATCQKERQQQQQAQQVGLKLQDIVVQAGTSGASDCTAAGRL